MCSSKLKELEKVAGEIATCKESIDKVADDKLALRQERSSIEAQLKQMENVSEDRVKELNNMRALVRQVKEECRKYDKAMDALESNKHDKQSKLMGMNAMINKIRSNENEGNEQVMFNFFSNWPLGGASKVCGYILFISCLFTNVAPKRVKGFEMSTKLARFAR